MSSSFVLRHALLALVLLPLIASAQTPPPPLPAGAPPAGAHRGPPPGLPIPPELRGVKLSEAQQDKVFQIMHEQSAALYEATKTAQRADAELHVLSLASNFDAARARVLAEAAGKAQGEIAYLHASSTARIFALLTPEQRRLPPEEGSRPPPRP
ncbi:hypothetical protein GCM10027046_16290 [Uliginosibacterium flavum]|uniref:Periplasmic heavy metal sensor n=1 Tax=Uliginosibacterium flavum TaxID=1396831 RepID=A0ABV2TP21_9RHOO